jgi:hypothetical protein
MARIIQDESRGKINDQSRRELTEESCKKIYGTHLFITNNEEF